jgi:hypothetical protein
MVSALINELVIYSFIPPQVFKRVILPFEGSCSVENSSLVDKFILIQQPVRTMYSSQ